MKRVSAYVSVNRNSWVLERTVMMKHLQAYAACFTWRDRPGLHCIISITGTRIIFFFKTQQSLIGVKLLQITSGFICGGVEISVYILVPLVFISDGKTQQSQVLILSTCVKSFSQDVAEKSFWSFISPFCLARSVLSHVEVLPLKQHCISQASLGK